MSEPIKRAGRVLRTGLFPALLAVVLQAGVYAQEEDTAQDAAQAFLEEVRGLYAIPLRDGLESFGIEITIYTVGGSRGSGRGGSGGRMRPDRITGDVTIAYEWEAPETEDFAVEGIPNQLRRTIGAPLRGIWKDIAGACVFPDLEGEGFSIEGKEEGMVVSRSDEDGSQASVLFDAATKLVLEEKLTIGDTKVIIVPTYGPADGLLRLEGKVVSVAGEGGGGTEGSYMYGGFRDIEGFSLPTQLSINLGESEVEMGFRYTHINGEGPADAGFDPEAMKAMVKDFKKAYSKWSKPEKIDGMKKLAVTEDEKAAESIAKKGLKDKDLSVREEAAVLLGRMGCRKVVSHLTKAMKANEDELTVYLAVIGALGDIGDPKAIPYLSKDLWNQKEAMTGIRVANAKIAALGKIRSKKSVDALVDMLFVAGPGAMARLSVSLTRSLESLTGQRFGWDRDRWKDWWKKNKSKFKLEEDR